MSIVYFASNAIGLTPKYTEHPEGGIVGNALLFYEGTHRDNAGRPHEVPAERINLFAVNTNQDFNQGVEIPLMIEHSKSLIGSNGIINKLGKITSPVYCRAIKESDLPNANMKQLIGKLGAFAQVHVVNRLDEVKNKTIRALSAGIDPVKNKFVEISAVAFPALSGASLLFSKKGARREALGNRQENLLVPIAYSPVPSLVVNFNNHGITDYNQAKENIEAWQKPYQELQKKFDIFVGTLFAIAREEQSDQMAFNSNQLKRKALEQYTEDLVDYLNISFDEIGQVEDGYNANPYEPNLYKNKINYSEAIEGNILNFTPKVVRFKRRKRGVN